MLSQSIRCGSYDHQCQRSALSALPAATPHGALIARVARHSHQCSSEERSPRRNRSRPPSLRPRSRPAPPQRRRQRASRRPPTRQPPPNERRARRATATGVGSVAIVPGGPVRKAIAPRLRASLESQVASPPPGSRHVSRLVNGPAPSPRCSVHPRSARKRPGDRSAARRWTPSWSSSARLPGAGLQVTTGCARIEQTVRRIGTRYRNPPRRERSRHTHDRSRRRRTLVYPPSLASCAAGVGFHRIAWLERSGSPADPFIPLSSIPSHLAGRQIEAHAQPSPTGADKEEERQTTTSQSTRPHRASARHPAIGSRVGFRVPIARQNRTPRSGRRASRRRSCSTLPRSSSGATIGGALPPSASSQECVGTVAPDARLGR